MVNLDRLTNSEKLSSYSMEDNMFFNVIRSGRSMGLRLKVFRFY